MNEQYNIFTDALNKTLTSPIKLSKAIDEFNDPRGAIISDDGESRYLLWRVWDNDKPRVAFIGLNPSKADAVKDDPTIRRVMNFAKDWGYGGVYMLNLFSYITPYPKELIIETNFTANDYFIDHYAGVGKEVIFAWGNFKEARIRVPYMVKKFPHAMVLQHNQNGTPKHPLYVRSDINRIQYNYQIPNN